MSSAALLQPGTVEAIWHASDDKKSSSSKLDVSAPYFQVLNVKPVPLPTGGGTPRCRVILSDGRHFMQAMLNTSLTHLALSDNPIIRQWCIIKVVQYNVNVAKDKKLCLVLNFDKNQVVYCDGKIGEPTSIDRDAASSMGSGPGMAAAGVAAASSAGAPPQFMGQSSANTASAAPFSSSGAGSLTSSVYSAGSGSNAGSGLQSYPSATADAAKRAIGSFSFSSYAAGENSAATPPTKRPYKKPPSFTGDPSSITTVPIAALSPYTDKWAVKVRVVSKTEIRTWPSNRPDGKESKSFSMIFIDESGQIKCFAYGKVADLFYPVFHQNHIYTIAGGTVRLSKGTINSYDIVLEESSCAFPVQDDSANSVPSISYNFVPIKEILNKEKDMLIDVIAVIKECSDVTQITTKATQKQLNKRDLTLIDSGGLSIKLTLWGGLAESFKYAADCTTVIAFKSVRITDFNIRSLSSVGSTTFCINPDIQDSYELRGWYDAAGFEASYEPISAFASSLAAFNPNGADGRSAPYSAQSAVHAEVRKPLIQIKEETAAGSLSDKAEYFTVAGVIAHIKQGSVTYPACPTENCNKKVIEIGDGQWKCEKCNATFPSCNHRFLFQLVINDFSSNIWANAFDETGQIIFGGRKAEDIYHLSQNDQNAYEQLIRDSERKMAKIKLRAKSEYYQGEQKIRFSITSIAPLSFVSECKTLIETIDKFIS